MSRNLTIVFIIIAVLIAFAVLGGLVGANTVYVRAHPIEKDFLVPWLAARTFIQYGNSPYSDPATQRVQIQFYGRLAVEGEDPLYLWVPFPIELLYFPFAFISNYIVARAVWLTCLEIALVALAFLSVRLTDWKPANAFLPFILLSSVFWVYGFFSISADSADAILALALAGFLLALREKRDEAAGALLLVSLFAPRICGIFFFFFIWWAFYHRRWRIVWGFLMTAGLLLALSFFFLADWPLTFLHGLLSRVLFDHQISSIGIFTAWSPVLGPRLGWALVGFLLLVLFIEWGNVLQQDFRHFLWTASLTLAATPLLGIPLSYKDFVFLFIPLVLFLSILARRFPHPKGWVVPAFVLLTIFAGLWVLAMMVATLGGSKGLGAGLFLILPVLLILGLYWLYWWFIRQLRTGLDIPE